MPSKLLAALLLLIGLFAVIDLTRSATTSLSEHFAQAPSIPKPATALDLADASADAIEPATTRDTR